MTKSAERKKRQTARAAARVPEKGVINSESGKEVEATTNDAAEETRANVASDESGEEELEHVETMRGMRFAVRPRDLEVGDMLDTARSARAATAA